MKSILRILALGVLPILAFTAVTDQGLAADKGSQLIFHVNMAHQNFISVANANDGSAVTVLVQYYNDETALVHWHLRVIPGGGNVMVDPFDQMIPGTADEDGMNYVNVSDELDRLPARTNEDDGPGMNSGRFLVVVTAVGANSTDNADTADVDEGNDGDVAMNVANILFPDFLAADMHGMDNIDNCGVITNDTTRAGTVNTSNVGYSENGPDGVFDCRKDDPATGTDDVAVNEADLTSKNVGALTVKNAEPVAFNHLTGHFTEALSDTDAGGNDQTMSWGGTPVVRPAVTTVNNMAMIGTDYQTLNGIDSVDNATMAFYPGGDPLSATDTTDTVEQIAVDGTGRLAEKDAGGQGLNIVNTAARAAFARPSRIESEEDNSTNRAIAGVGNMTGTPAMQVPHGALVLPALYGRMHTTQVALLLSVADDFGDPRHAKGGDYKLIPAMTGYKVILQDNMGDALPDPKAADDPKFGGAASGDAPAGVNIIVNGLSVMTDADLGKCKGEMIEGHWTLANLVGLVPTAASGAKTFAGLDAPMDPMMNTTPGLIKFVRSQLTCKREYGDESPAGPVGEGADGVPITAERTYKAGTLVMEQQDSMRSFVTTGQALLKFVTPDSSFAASWSLKSPPDAGDDVTN